MMFTRLIRSAITFTSLWVSSAAADDRDAKRQPFSADRMDTILYGVSYYPEYMPEERLGKDVALMQQAGINVVRLGESTWSSWEPRDGEFHFDIVGENPYFPAHKRFNGKAIWFNGDVGRSLKHTNYLLTETNAQTIGWDSRTQFPPYPGQLRQAAYAHLAAGANMVAYWQWASALYGQETYWKGILSHDLEPNRVNRELSQVAGELKRLGLQLVNLKAGLASRDQSLPGTVRVRHGLNNREKQIHYHFNFSARQEQFANPYAKAVELLKARNVETGESLTLPPWALAILVEQ